MKLVTILLQKISKYSIVTTSLIIVILLSGVIAIQSPRSIWLSKTEIVVDGVFFDSLIAIANRPPIIDTIIIKDTIQGETIYKDKLVPMYLDSTLSVYKDGLITNHFSVSVLDSLKLNKILSRTWDYETYVDTVIIYIEKEKPVIFYIDRLIYLSDKGFYGGPSISFYKHGFSLLGEVLYKTDKNFYYGGGLGVFTLHDDKMKYYPTINLKVGKKF